MYFSFFKPQDWRKRSVVRGRGFIQRFLKYADKRVDVLKANLLRDELDLRLRFCQQPFGPVHTKAVHILAERNAGLLRSIFWMEVIWIQDPFACNFSLTIN